MVLHLHATTHSDGRNSRTRDQDRSCDSTAFRSTRLCLQYAVTVEASIGVHVVPAGNLPCMASSARCSSGLEVLLRVQNLRHQIVFCISTELTLQQVQISMHTTYMITDYAVLVLSLAGAPLVGFSTNLAGSIMLCSASGMALASLLQPCWHCPSFSC